MVEPTRSHFELKPEQYPEQRALPDPYRFLDGSAVRSVKDWHRRREEILALVQRIQYGQLPAAPERLQAEYADGKLTIRIEDKGRSTELAAEVRLPASDLFEPCPVFIHSGGLEDALYLSRGYALIRIHPAEIASDDGNRAGAFHALYPEADTGALLAWAWGIHRIIDALSALPQVNREQIAVTGHSRFGKAALAAGVFDERIGLTVPVCSGLSGAGNYRCFYEESGANEKLENIVAYAPHWFNPALAAFQGQACRLPYDQHEIVAVLAPRAVLMTEGMGDHWSNPQGTGLTYHAAKQVFDYLGVSDRIGIHYRPGGHAMTGENFAAMLDFADRLWRHAAVETDFDHVPYPDAPSSRPWRIRHPN